MKNNWRGITLAFLILGILGMINIIPRNNKNNANHEQVFPANEEIVQEKIEQVERPVLTNTPVPQEVTFKISPKFGGFRSNKNIKMEVSK